MSQRPEVTVLVGAYHHERWIEEALDSLAAQTFDGPMEVLITDDASTDDTVGRIRSWLARTGFAATLVVNERNLGVCASRNRALARTSGRFVCSLSGDDAHEPERIARQHAALAAAPDTVAAVYSDMREVDADGRDLGTSFLARSVGEEPPPEGDIFRTLIPWNWLPAPAVMVRRSALEAVGPYDESLVFEDLDMWLRLADRFEFRHVPGELVRYRISEAGMSFDPAWREAIHLSQARLLAKWLGADRELDQRIHDWMWHCGNVFLDEDSPAAVPLLAAAAEVRSVRPAWFRWAFRAARRAPGARGLLRTARGRVRRSAAAHYVAAE